jgi:DNA-binding MarR family transcriptional regulator
VAGKIQQELRQGKPFRQVEEEAALNIIRTADAFHQQIADVLKEAGLSPTQYNILRILRGSPDGLCCKEVGERLIARDPDITRIMDRLEKRKLIVRERAKEDRRFVTARLTDDGLKMVNDLDKPVENLQGKLLHHMSKAKLAALIELLEEARSAT